MIKYIDLGSISIRLTVAVVVVVLSLVVVIILGKLFFPQFFSPNLPTTLPVRSLTSQATNLKIQKCGMLEEYSKANPLLNKVITTGLIRGQITDLTHKTPDLVAVTLKSLDGNQTETFELRKLNNLVSDTRANPPKEGSIELLDKNQMVMIAFRCELDLSPDLMFQPTKVTILGSE